MKPWLTTRRFGIGLKIALISWAVTIVTLLIFVAVTVPGQKRIIEDNLASKARGLSASLQDVIATAAISEDYSTVVDHCRQVLQGDDTVVYIVITKNDGFSLIHVSAASTPAEGGAASKPEPQWRQDTLDDFWRPPIRSAISSIGTIPPLNRRVFHHAKPFDYSGIEWGWINVGLSLDAYDRSVMEIYRRTTLLALACIAFSLVVSLLYAQRMVRPVRVLQGVQQRVSAGDLSVRAEISSGDEIENLAESFNAMTATLLQRDRILESVRLAAQMFLFSSDWKQVVPPVLARLGESSGSTRVDVFALHPESPGDTWVSHPFTWSAADAVSPRTPAKGTTHPWRMEERDALIAEFQNQGMIAGLLRQQSPLLKAWLEPLGFLSLVLTPITVRGTWWGILCLGECRSDRQWTEPEKDSLRAVADMLGATIERHQTQNELLEAKDSLEKRVLERTSALEEQMVATGRAHKELADAQHRLMDVSRQAGMAEVATGVLHNVGNVLNSVNVSINLIRERLDASEIASLQALDGLLKEHPSDLAAFLTLDPVGREIPRFISHLADQLGDEVAILQKEQGHLARNVEHIKEIISMQQDFARASSYLEPVSLPELLEDALRLNASALLRNRVKVFRSFQSLPPQLMDRHKVLQILVNLIKNADHALASSEPEARRLELGICQLDPGSLEIRVRDNGMGIPLENLTRIFSHGFSTRPGGHGFGLHIAALAARELEGELRVHSAGEGAGATFTLQLPYRPVPQETGVHP